MLLFCSGLFDDDDINMQSAGQPVDDVVVEYVSADVSELASFVGEQEFEEFKRIFDRFATAEELVAEKVGACLG